MLRRLIIAVVMTSSFAFAQAPVPLPGFPLTIIHTANAAPPGVVLVDLTGDGAMEIVVPGRQFMYVFKHDGSLLPGWPQTITRQNYIRYGPTVGDITGDGNVEILCLTDFHGAPQPSDFDSTFLFAWHLNGELVSGFPVSYGNAYHAPVLYDIDASGSAEIVMVWADTGDIADHRMTILNGDGTMRPGWPQPFGTTRGGFLSSPAVGDIDGDGIADVVMSIHSFVPGQPATVHAWDALTATVKPGFPYAFPPLFFATFDRLLFPADSLGKRKVLTYASSQRFNPYSDSTLVVVLEPNGDVVADWPQPMRGWLSATKFCIADLFGDGLHIGLLDSEFEMRIWHPSGYLRSLWSVGFIAGRYLYAAGLEWPSPLMQILRESNINHNHPNPGPVMGAVIANRADGSTPSWSPLTMEGWTAFSPPAFGDINGDGIADMVIVAWDDSVELQRAYVHAFTFPGVPFNRETFPWPMPGHDRWRTSQYGFEPPDSIVVNVREPALLPDKIILHQNYPNPFNPSTRITYELPHRTQVGLSVTNVLGQTVKILVDEERPSGRHHVWFDATGLASGVYFYRLEGEGVRMVRKMILLR